MLRWFARFLFFLIVLFVLAGIAITWRLWTALPRTSGRVSMAGLSAPIEILRDPYGVPHIRAHNENDAWFGLGVVHAQDRLWQMEFQRRLGRGRLAEILGPQALESDLFLRTLGFGRVAAETWQRTPAAARASTEAYVRGVNAVIAQQASWRRPIEFALLQTAPEPWTPEDTIVWARVMSLGLDTNYRDELLRERIVARLGLDSAKALMPEYTVGGPLILPEGMPAPFVPPQPDMPQGADPSRATVPPAETSPRPNADVVTAQLARVSAMASARGFPPAWPSVLDDNWQSGGSNNWVVSGARSVTGKPLLACDPHVNASLPSTWYVAHLQGGPLNVIGATMPGVAAVPIGHNDRMAWGVTVMMADVQDLYLEHVNAKNEAEFQGAWEPMRITHDVIRVKGAPDVGLAVRHTRHGPLISDVIPGAYPTAIALRWTALDPDDGLVDGQRLLPLARNWTEFTLAASKLKTPMLNFVYADVDGNIGYFAPGALPLRVHDGTQPVPGWTGTYEWNGLVPVDQLPRIENPTRGFVVTANNKVLPDPYVTTISTNWEPGYRAARITTLIEKADRLSVDGFAQIQGDVRTPEVQRLLPWMRRARPIDEDSRRTLERMATWDGALTADSPEAALFVAWTHALARELFADELGPELWTAWSQWSHWRAKALDHVVGQAGERWCDDVRTPQTEGCEYVIGVALRRALDDVAERQQNKDMTRWRLGAQNEVTFPHSPFEAVGWLRPFFSRHSAVGGNATTVAPVMPTPRGQVIASFRQIVDLADFDNSRWVLPPGQSGQLLSGHYADQLERWASGEYERMLFSRKAVNAAVVRRLVLEPARR